MQTYRIRWGEKVWHDVIGQRALFCVQVCTVYNYDSLCFKEHKSALTKLFAYQPLRPFNTIYFLPNMHMHCKNH